MIDTIDKLINHKTKAFMTTYFKPLLQVVAAVNVPTVLADTFVFFSIDQNEISEMSVFVTQVGGAIFICFKIFDWISGKFKNKK
jgi:hypothetical protein